MLIGRDRSFRSWSFYQDMSPRWVGLHGPSLVSMGHFALAEVRKSVENMEFGLPCHSKIVQDGNRRSWTQQHDCVPNRPSGASIDRVRGFRILQEVQKRGQWRHSLPRAPKQDGNTRATCRGVVYKTASPAAHKRMNGKYLFDVFGGSGFLARATTQMGLRGYVLDTKVGPPAALYPVTGSSSGQGGPFQVNFTRRGSRPDPGHHVNHVASLKLQG